MSAMSYWSKQLTESAQIQEQENREPFHRTRSLVANGLPLEGLISQPCKLSQQPVNHSFFELFMLIKLCVPCTSGGKESLFLDMSNYLPLFRISLY